MKGTLTAVFLVLTLCGASPAPAATPQVALEQTLVGYSSGSGTVTLNYSLHVTNLEQTPIEDLSLTLVPHPPAALKKMTVTVDYLGPHESVYVPVQLVTPALLNRERYARVPLFWEGKYFNTAGQAVEFPMVSKPGGAK